MTTVNDLNSLGGRATLPQGWNYNPVQGLFADADVKTVGDMIQPIRSLRRLKIDSVIWCVERHQRQCLLGKPTTLSASEFVELSQYIEDLCDFPETLDIDGEVLRGDVLDGLNWPKVPDALLPKIMRRDGGFV